jgi:hypothetical protein
MLLDITVIGLSSSLNDFDASLYQFMSFSSGCSRASPAQI